MPGIAKKLRYLIGNQSVNSWANDHDFTPQTVHDWIKFDRRPTGASMKSLVAATGKPKEWWLDGKDPALEPTPPILPAPQVPAPVQEMPKPAPPQINVNALVRAIVVTFQTAPPGETLENTARKAVGFYQYCMDQGMITLEGEGTGNLKNVA